MCVYRKMVDSGGVPGKGIILASIEKTIPASTGNGSNMCEFRKRVESGRVPGKGRTRASTVKSRICASTEKLSGRVSKNGRIQSSTGKC